MENWAARHFMKLSNGKFQVLLLETNNPMHQYRLGIDQLESNFIEKDLRVLVDKLDISQQHALAVKATNHIMGCISKSIDSRLRKLSVCKATVGILCLVWGSPVQEKQRTKSIKMTGRCIDCKARDRYTSHYRMSQ
ncbi:hypothetical protein QYF61_016393 [Mycteria americana]|uniref:Uncharacterized protein n=1 Tax=Mycteria americana TaxID=33587 RepID=A0AAN7MQJ4_MYCAM|nr:hypothetical protein QYF61_016393 [Mycteria americana]